MKAGFIGLGAMGYAMAANLHRAGLLACVYNRSAGSRDHFAAEFGVTAVSDPAELAAACDAIVLCVSADADVLQMITAIAPRLHPDTLVIDCSTVASDTDCQAAEMVIAAGGSFLDAPVSGGTEGAANATLSIMAGGDAASFERAQPLFQAMGKNIVHMGPIGAGQATKAVNQVMGAGVHQAVAEAMAFAEALALPLDKVVDVVGAGASGNWFVNHRGKSMVRGEYAGFGFKLSLHHKDMLICRRMAQANGGHLPLAEQTIADQERLMADGYGDEDVSALYRLKRGLFQGG
ncbi:MAG: NAD(P)-dependent oxidoreductase [Salinisphaera sp.]|nr:NAD(P)-dependent oxidoreductase [Salinisphaera sp.]